jgi:hypothetical protein
MKLKPIFWEQILQKIRDSGRHHFWDPKDYALYVDQDLEWRDLLVIPGK